MFNRLRGRFSSAHAIALIALFVALAGGAYAATIAPKNSVNSTSVIDESLLSKDVKNGTLRSKDVKDNGLTGVDVNESSLGTVPNAAKLGGKTAAAFAPSSQVKRFAFSAVDATADSVPTSVGIDAVGPFTVSGSCKNTGGGNLLAMIQITSSAGWSFDGSGPSSDADDPGVPATVQEVIALFGPTLTRRMGSAEWAANSGPNHINGLASLEVNPTTHTCEFGYSRFGG